MQEAAKVKKKIKFKLLQEMFASKHQHGSDPEVASQPTFTNIFTPRLIYKVCDNQSRGIGQISPGNTYILGRREAGTWDLYGPWEVF